MSLSALREEVCRANRELVAALAMITLWFGNASGMDRAGGVLVIKPSRSPLGTSTTR